jgi:hypothetical protein
MGRIVRDASRVSVAAILLFGCAPAAGSPATHTEAVVAPSSPWATQPCVVIDTTARTADTLRTVGVVLASHPISAWPNPCGLRPVEPVSAPPLVPIVVPIGVDLREIIDGASMPAGAPRPDVIATSNAGVLTYATGLSGYFTEALPWTSTYVLVPARPRATATPPSAAERDALARDAVLTDARGAAAPYAWRTDSACEVVRTGPASDPRPVVAYPDGDATARQLAERIVSLAGAAPGMPWVAGSLGSAGVPAHVRAAGVPADSIPTVLASGAAAAAVIAIARDPRTVCGTAGNARVPADAVPLIDVRSHVIVRRGSGAAFLIGADGSLEFFRQDTR